MNKVESFLSNTLVLGFVICMVGAIVLGTILIWQGDKFEEGYKKGYVDASWPVIYDVLTGDSKGNMPVEKVLDQALERFRYWWFGRYSLLDFSLQWYKNSSIYSLEVCRPLNVWRWDKGVFADDLTNNEPLFFYMVGNPWHGTRVTGEEIKKFYEEK